MNDSKPATSARPVAGSVHIDRLSITIKGSSTAEATQLARQLPAAIERQLAGGAHAEGDLAGRVAGEITRALASQQGKRGEP
jgi:hypothetical protein